MKAVALITLGLMLVFQVVYQEAATTVEAAVAMPPSETRLTRPQKCEQFRKPRTEDEWDEERQEYWPPNHEWEACMGVERK